MRDALTVGQQTCQPVQRVEHELRIPGCVQRVHPHRQPLRSVTWAENIAASPKTPEAAGAKSDEGDRALAARILRAAT